MWEWWGSLGYCRLTRQEVSFLWIYLIPWKLVSLSHHHQFSVFTYPCFTHATIVLYTAPCYADYPPMRRVVAPPKYAWTHLTCTAQNYNIMQCSRYFTELQPIPNCWHQRCLTHLAKLLSRHYLVIKAPFKISNTTAWILLWATSVCYLERRVECLNESCKWPEINYQRPDIYF